VPEAVITVVRAPDDGTPETCRAAYRNIINWIQSHLVGQLLNLKIVLKPLLPVNWTKWQGKTLLGLSRFSAL